ncbi:MAG: tRNA pseudouridine(38-40) synthase TruA [Solirubrobacterales bacterium]
MATRLLIEYDGSDFRGWAKQPGHRTVQAELERALAVVRREPTTVTVAGRTDAGVHAWGQVASHAGDPARTRSLNALLPPDIAVLSSDPAPDGFDARSHARSRTYCYRVSTREQRPAIERGRVYWWTHDYDRSLLDQSAALLHGEHDFEAFTLADQPYVTHRRTVRRAEWTVKGDLLEFWITCDAFTRRMVRSLVSYQLDIARRARTLDAFSELLAGAPRSAGGGTAPAHGLYLAEVGFDRPEP